MPKPSKKKCHGYGQGQREQYGEGQVYRPEDLTKGADESNNQGGFAGGERRPKSLPDPKEPEGD